MSPNPARRRIVTMAPEMHGTKHGYDTQGCRCAACTEAHRRYHVDRRKRLYASRVVIDGDLVAPVAPELHGRAATYNNAGCRCPACRAAHAAAVAATRQKRKAAP